MNKRYRWLRIGTVLAIFAAGLVLAIVAEHTGNDWMKIVAGGTMIISGALWLFFKHQAEGLGREP